MRYEEPIFRYIGDSYVGVEFGDDADLRHNFRVIALAQALSEDKHPWLVESITTLREFGVVYDRLQVAPEKVAAAIREILPSVAVIEKVKSRLFTLPTWYRDPFTEELNRRAGLEPSVEIIGRQNGCSGDEAVKRHSENRYWVSCVGWGPGCYFAYPIDRARGLSVSKLPTARPYTPERTLALGGACTACTPMPGPSGYEMLGRLAVPIYRPKADLPGLPPHGVPFVAGDRHRYLPIGPLEYEAAQEKVNLGSYEYDFVTEDFFFSDLETGGYRD